VEKATYSLLHEILLATNSKNTVGGIFCNLQKAFDWVNHNISLKKLKFNGIKGTFYTFIKSYLEQRYKKLITSNSTAN
jgi:Reverse transcriptase (RNA-dependent DNA polymerase).